MNDTSLLNLAVRPGGPRQEAIRTEQALVQIDAIMNELAASTASADRMGEMVAEHLATGGKRLRARLALATGNALGADPHATLQWAAACEMLHNASLVHDDLQDGDRVRRGRPTTWVVHGSAQAVNVGDLMLMLPFAALERMVNTPAATLWSLSRLLAASAAETVRGQSAEMDLLPRRRLNVDDYLQVVEGKTAALFAMPVHGAALLAGFSEDEAGHLAAPFRLLGQLFQLQDDVLDLYGDKGRHCVGSDLREGKVSALVVEHIARRPGDLARLLTLLETPREQTLDCEVAWATGAFVGSGALHAALTRIRRLADAVTENQALNQKTGMRPVADALLSRCLSPIQHLLTPESMGADDSTRGSHVG